MGNGIAGGVREEGREKEKEGGEEEEAEAEEGI